MKFHAIEMRIRRRAKSLGLKARYQYGLWSFREANDPTEDWFAIGNDQEAITWLETPVLVLAGKYKVDYRLNLKRGEQT
jgi:hypothetical protein